MLKFNTQSINNLKPGKRTTSFFRGLILGATVLLLAHAAPASAVINSFTHTFRAVMTNTGVDSNARGAISGNINRRGVTDNQRLTVIVSRLDANATYHIVAFLGDDSSPTAVADFQTGSRGGASFSYLKRSHPVLHALPAAADPISNIRELDIVNANGDTVLQADLTDPNSFSYSVQRAMENTGVIAGAGGVLRLGGGPHSTRASITATGLAPRTSYQLLINGVGVKTKTSDRRGNLLIAGPLRGMELVLDIRTVALADASGTTNILISTGLGIPGVISTAGLAPVVLRTAGTYAVLGGATVTSTGNTDVTGDLGVWSGSAVTGFAGIVPGGPGVVHGTIHAGDAAAQVAQGNLTTAYNDAKGRTLAPVDVANADLGGRTLAPGLYKSTGTLSLTGDVTLDGNGDNNSVWIFQIASALNTASGSHVVLINGAKAANVFWQVGTSATLGTTTDFSGTIMADQSISFGNGARLTGRALARIASVTMDANVIAVPTP